MNGSVGYEELTLPAGDETPLFVRRFTPAGGAGGRTLLIVHGASEHGERYEHAARLFVDRGWTVIVPDHRGHGRSGGVPTHVDAFRQYVDDLEVIRDHFGLGPRRTVMYGHSMGGLVSVRYHQTFPGRTAALVLMSPLLGIKAKVPLLKLAVGHLVRYFNPRYRFETTIKMEHTTRSQEILELRQQDRLMKRTITAGWFFAMKASIRRAWDQAGSVEVPLLVVQGTQDVVVDPAVTEPWFDLVGSRDKTLRFLHEHFHELHHEPDWQQTLTDVADWLEERVPAEAGTAALTASAEPAAGTA